MLYYYKKVQTFTLVELLVVIAIISILASLLLPTLQESIRSAHDVSCKSNLRQHGLNFTIYTNEHDSYLPVWYSNWGTHWNFLFIQMKYINDSGYINTNYNNGSPWDRPGGILSCPAAPSLTKWSTSSGYRFTHYALNEYTYNKYNATANPSWQTVSGNPEKAPYGNPQVASILMLTDNNRENGVESDAAKPSSFYANATTYSYVQGVRPSTTDAAGYGMRHGDNSGNTANVIYWDIHVSSLNPKGGKGGISYYYVNTGTVFFKPTGLIAN